MTHKLLIEIGSNRVTCGRCEHLYKQLLTGSVWWCCRVFFGANLGFVGPQLQRAIKMPNRPNECLKAQGAADVLAEHASTALHRRQPRSRKGCSTEHCMRAQGHGGDCSIGCRFGACRRKAGPNGLCTLHERKAAERPAKPEQRIIVRAAEPLLAESIELIRKHEPPEGYHGCFSGGKDSVLLKEIARLAGVRVRWHYNVTTIDPPELVEFIRRAHPDVEWLKPRIGFFARMEEKGRIPTRRMRWCCDEFKERRPPKGEILLMGIRAEESAARKTWKAVDELRYRPVRQVVLPILEWASDELWSFVRERELPMCSLYDEGFKRLGCIGCPLANYHSRRREFDRWPGLERRWQLAFKRVWNMRAGSLQRNGREWFGSALFNNWEEMWSWWMNGKRLPERKEPLAALEEPDAEE